MLKIHSTEKLFEQTTIHAESEFEKRVLKRLVQAGYRVTPQWKVGGYRIDMVVEGGGKRLAVECDGDKYHTIENLVEDMNRQAILERLGWRFVRIRGSQFFRDPDKTMQSIFDKLDQLEILPELQQSHAKGTTAKDDQLAQRFIIRAAEIRREWKEKEKPVSNH